MKETYMGTYAPSEMIDIDGSEGCGAQPKQSLKVRVGGA